MSQDANAEPEIVFVNNGVDKTFLRAISAYGAEASTVDSMDDSNAQVNSIVYNLFAGDATPTPDNVTQQWSALAQPEYGIINSPGKHTGNQTHKAEKSTRPDPPFLAESP